MSAELISFVNTAEGVSAAVQNGADAVMVSLAAGSISGLSAAEFSGAAEFCRIRGVKIYAEFGAAVADSEVPSAVAALSDAWVSGADGIVLCDMGLLLSLRRALPETPIHLSGKLGIHSFDGIQAATAMGASRVILPQGLSLEDIESIAAASPLELAMTVHGFICPAGDRGCIFSAFSDGTSALRSRCSRECLKEYATGTKLQNPFTMKELCLAYKVSELSAAGVSAFILDGTDRKPEYIAMLTSIYSSVVKLQKKPTEDELSVLGEIEPNNGFTEGALGDGDVFSSPVPSAGDNSALLSTIRRSYLRREFQRVPVSFVADISLSGPLRLAVTDDRGNFASGEAGKSELAFHRELTQTSLQTELYKTGGTPFYCESVRCRVPKGLTIKSEVISSLRDKLLAELMEQRKPLGVRSVGAPFVLKKKENSSDIPVLTVSVLKVSQLSQRILELAPPFIYVPLDEALSGGEKLAPFISAEGIEVCAVLPPIISDRDKGDITAKLLNLRQLGISHVEVNSPWHTVFLRKLGFRVHGGMGLGIISSGILTAAGAFGLDSALLSPELTSLEVSSISKIIPTELMVYGRLPLMETDLCLIRNITGLCSCDSFSGISDSSGLVMPVMKARGCGNTVYSSKKLYLLHRSREYMTMGLWGVRLCFTTENVRECAAVTERFLGLGSFEPSSYTYGKF